MAPASQAKALGTAAIGRQGTESRCLPPSRAWMAWVLSLVSGRPRARHTDRARHSEPDGWLGVAARRRQQRAAIARCH